MLNGSVIHNCRQQGAASYERPLTSLSRHVGRHRLQKGWMEGRRRAPSTKPSAGAMDVMPTWTLDQIAGLLFGVGRDIGLKGDVLVLE